MTVRFSSPLWRGDAGLGVLVPDISDLYLNVQPCLSGYNSL